MQKNYEVEFEREYNRMCGAILRTERERRRVSLEDLSSGLLSGTALGHMESGKIGWRKVMGDTLMNRMGIATDYFEVVASSDELDRWRMREDICLLIPAEPRAAERKLQEYRQQYAKREPVEEQFLLKAELLLMLLEKKNGRGMEGFSMEREFSEGEFLDLLERARNAVSCTVSGDWEWKLERLWLGPGELEAVLLAAAVRMAFGRDDEAWELQQTVWNYPRAHQWKERVTALILPQAALLGMRLALKRGDGRAAFLLGKEAIELLRRVWCHCYILPLLDLMGEIPAETVEDREYLEQTARFRAAFRGVYRQYDYPEYRVWQGISVDNTKEAGLVLKMLRRFAGKSRAKAVYDGTEPVVTERQLEKIEKGTHKPSYENYRRLVKQYGKYGAWKVAMVETDSVEILELRQQISTLIALCEWARMSDEVGRFRKKVDESYPRVKQELLFWDAVIKRQKENVSEEVLDMLLQALYCTISDSGGRNLKWWVFQREEIIIASNIASDCRKLGRLEEAREWLEAIKFSLEQQMDRTRVGYYGYDILMESYDNFLGDIKRFGDAVKMDTEAVKDYLKHPRNVCLASTLYRIAWNSYEMASEDAGQYEILHPKWKENFQLAEALADFTYDSELLKFLKNRHNKFLT